MNKMFKLSSVVAALVVSGMLVGCGSSSNDGGENPNPGPNPDPKPVVETVEKTVTVIDSAVKNATVSVKGSKIAGVPSGANGKATVKYEKSITEPVFVSIGGKTASGLQAPNMQSKGDVINPYTTMTVAGKDVAASLGLTDAQKAHISGDYSAVQDTDFAKATVALSRLLACQPVVRGADNATAIASVLEGAAGATTAAKISQLSTENTPAKSMLAQIATITDAGKTVAEVEQALKDSGKVDCDTTTGGDTGGNTGGHNTGAVGR